MSTEAQSNPAPQSKLATATRQLIVIGGPNGTGKTTLADEFLDEQPCIYLSADLMAYKLAPEAPDGARFSAGKAYFAALNEAMKTTDSILIESTLSGIGMARTFERAREAEMPITLVMMFLDGPETCLKRVQQRVQKGGHNVPDRAVRRRFWRSIRNFWESYRFLADQWVLVYNAESQFHDVAMGAEDSFIVQNEALFGQFLALVNDEKTST